jgi:hypothetical protein
LTALQLDEARVTTRRKGPTDYMIDMITMHSPAMSAFRDEGRRQDELQHRLFVLHQAGLDDAGIYDEIDACFDRQMATMRWVDSAFAAVFARDDR